MKQLDPMKVEAEAAERFVDFLNSLPSARATAEHPARQNNGYVPDLVVDLEIANARHRLVCEVKYNGELRAVRDGIVQLTHMSGWVGQDAHRVFIAPYLGPSARALCLEAGVNYFDFYDNCRLYLPMVFIDHAGVDRPASEPRALRSMFKPKSAQVLRRLLADPNRAYRLAELAEAAQVSLGQVHKVKEALMAREWAEATPDGVRLSNPRALLLAWRDVYEPPRGRSTQYYTTLHGRELEAAAERAMVDANWGEVGIAWSGYSAANWLAPYGRGGMMSFYVRPSAEDGLAQALNLTLAPSGGNVSIKVLEDEGPMLDTVSPLDGVHVTSPVQTYLDLSALGERGEEAADYLLRERLPWMNR